MTKSRIINSNYDPAYPVAKLKEHPQNPRRGDVDVIADSIGENGFYGAVVVQQSTGYVLAGNHRLRACAKKGIDHVPVIFVDVDDDRARRILLVDNRSNDIAAYDDSLRAALLQQIIAETGTLAGTGHDEKVLADILAGLQGISEPELNELEPPVALEYRVVIDCDSEEHQARLLEVFESEGLKCRALIS